MIRLAGLRPKPRRVRMPPGLPFFCRRLLIAIPLGIALCRCDTAKPFSLLPCPNRHEIHYRICAERKCCIKPPMNFYILTLFPEMITQGLNHSIIKRALANKLITLNCINIRDFADNKHKKTDDYPYGGGVGLVMQPWPVYNAFKSIEKFLPPGCPVIYLSPRGSVFKQEKAFALAKEKTLVLLCGHYEGIDQRVIDEIVTEEISIGDYILTGGELAAMVIIDATARLADQVISKKEATLEESFNNNLLEHNHYTRPAIFLDKKVPDVLLSGHHKKIADFRKAQAIEITKKRRPDLKNGQTHI